MTDTLYTPQDCGCLALVLVDEPDNLKYCASDIAKELRKGRTLRRVTVEEFRAGTPPLRCPEHKREADERKAQATLGL